MRRTRMRRNQVDPLLTEYFRLGGGGYRVYQWRNDRGEVVLVIISFYGMQISMLQDVESPQMAYRRHELNRHHFAEHQRSGLTRIDAQLRRLR
jgi:hypothetical protein